MADPLYNSDFGFVDLSLIPEEIRPAYPALEALFEASYCRGENLVGTAHVVEEKECIEGEPTGRIITTIAFPVTGELRHEVSRK